MARPSRVKSPKAKFVVYEDADTSIPSPDSRQPSSASKNDDHAECESDLSEYVGERTLEDIAEDITPSSIIGEQTDTEVDNDNDHEEDDDEDRRESTLTRGTSISSLPESSVFDTDYESRLPAMHQPYTPPSVRPTFRRPESVRRMQLMASPTPFERSSPRRTALHAKSRTGTPRSVRKSPRPKSRYQEEEDNMDEEKKEYPLVLLHVTLLPVELRWSAESMMEILPPHVIENLQLLRSRVSDTILNRGILLPHPREEYERLEERLLEALELRKERVTKCGHFFRARDSTSSLSSGDGSVHSADSGVGSSVANEDVERCTTCSSPVKGTNTALDADGRKWSIKVFAANGLMRASAWTAAWSEMERVDVEILPWISEDLRKKLDAMAEREEHSQHRRLAENEAHVKERANEHLRIAHNETKCPNGEERAPEEEHIPRLPEMHSRAVRGTATVNMDLPQVYRTADIPLSILLRNYIYLLAQDKRNIAIFALATLTLWTSLRAAVLPSPPPDLVSLPSTCNMPPEPIYFESINATAALASDSSTLDILESSVAEEATGSIPSPTIEDGMQPKVVTAEDREADKGEREPTNSSESIPLSTDLAVSHKPNGSRKEPMSLSSGTSSSQLSCVNLNSAEKIFALERSTRSKMC